MRVFRFRFETAILAIVFLMGFLILFVFGEAYGPLQRGDAALYVKLANNLIDYGVLSGSDSPPIQPNLYRLPGYPFFLVPHFLFFGSSFLPVRITQFLLFGLMVIIVYRMVRSLIDKRTAIIAAILCATYLPLIFFATLLLTEILSTFLVVSAMCLLMLRSEVSKPAALYFIVGLLLGMLALVRPSFSLIILFVGVGLVLNNYFDGKSILAVRSLLFVMILFLGFGVVMTPWIARNYSLSHRFMVSPSGAESLYWSIRQYKGSTNYNLTGQWDTQYLPELARKGAIAKQEVAEAQHQGSLDMPPSIAEELSVEQQWRADIKIEAENLTLWQILGKLPGRVLALWMPSYMHAPSWLYVPLFQRLPEVQVWGMLFGAFIGLWLRRKQLINEWPLWVVGIYLTIVHMVVHLETRYSIPGHPFMLIYSAAGYLWIYQLIKRSSFHWFRVSK